MVQRSSDSQEKQLEGGTSKLKLLMCCISYTVKVVNYYNLLVCPFLNPKWTFSPKIMIR